MSRNLVVDDYSRIRELVIVVLQGVGFGVIEAGDGVHAMARLELVARISSTVQMDSVGLYFGGGDIQPVYATITPVQGLYWSAGSLLEITLMSGISIL